MTIQFPQIDWTTLIPNLVGLFFDAIGKWLTDAMAALFNTIWNSGGNVLGQTSLDLTWNLPAIAGQVVSVQDAARAVLVFALILLGLRGMLSAIVPSQPDMLGEGVNGILGAIILSLAFPVLIPDVIRLLNETTGAIFSNALGPYTNLLGLAVSPFLEGILLVVVAFFVVRLLIKAVWRIGFLAVLLPVGMAACVLWAIPQARWIMGWWARTWGGMLVAQVPSVLALAIGLGMSGVTGGGVGSFIWSIAFLQLAHDLYDIIPTGMARGQSSPLSALAGAAALVRFGAGLGTAGVAAAASAAIPTNELTTRAEMYGYD